MEPEKEKKEQHASAPLDQSPVESLPESISQGELAEANKKYWPEQPLKQRGD